VQQLRKATKAPAASFNFTITTDGDTINIDNPALMKKMAEAAVYLVTVEDQDGQLIISRKRAKHMRTWEKILKVETEDVILEGLIKRRTKRGFVVDVDGIEAFLPGIIVAPNENYVKGNSVKFRIVYSEPQKNALILGSAILPKAEVKLMASMLNMREIISLHIGQA
jgi:small subunit ribosomal protein S1